MAQAAEHTINDAAGPLAAFCGEAATQALEFVSPLELPQPYRRLLAHERDMTGALEDYREQEMVLHPIEQLVDGERVRRHVELCGRRDNQPAEFGAIEIDLSLFDGPTRQEILDGKVPLGTILKRTATEFVSRPRAYFRIRPGAAIRRFFGFPGDGWLYGRCNQLLTADQGLIADVVEILPPHLPAEER